ncbi:MAG: lysine--tRNA ligase [Spirochaetes bacterium]|nr:MAG: lysine--tRNA ligase [Spirochaetota bacterium]
MPPVFWSDRLAEELIKRKKYNYIDKDIPKIKNYFIKSSTSISGIPHIGNASDVIRHDALLRSLRSLGKDAKLYWIAEDMDALRKVPAGIPKEFKKYLGMPVADIPCPENCCGSYSEHFCKLFSDSLKEKFGVDLVFKSTSQSYRSGEFTPYIKKAMDNLNLIKEIWNKSRENPLPENWTPWKPVCANCGKIMTTVVTDYDEKGVKYVCKDYEFKEYGKNAYTKVPGCGYEGESKFKDGNGKLLWRVEWAMEWAAWKISFEGAGKEHFMPSGSFWTAGEISERVFDWPEPHPSENPLQPYEYLTVDNNKMSASVGNVVSTWDWPDFAPPQVLRLIFLKKLRKVRDFSYQKIPDYVDEYDKLQRIYFGIEKVDNEKELVHLKRLYEMIEIGNIPKELPVQIPFSFASLISQLSKPNESMEKAISLLKSTGHITGDLSEEDLKRIKKRLLLAREWARRYAPEQYKIKLQEKIPKDIKLSPEQKRGFEILRDELQRDWNADDLQNRIYEIGKEIGDVKGFFQALYKILIGKKYGPRTGPFILAIGKDKVRKILEQI